MKRSTNKLYIKHINGSYFVDAERGDGLVLLVDDLDRVVNPGHLLQHVVVVAAGEVSAGRRRRVVASSRQRRRTPRLAAEDVLDEDLLHRLLPHQEVPESFDRP